MLLNSYQELSRTTAIYPNVETNLHYPTLGLVDEIGEFDEAIGIMNRQKEAGDVMWYVAQLATTIGVNLQDIYLSSIQYDALEQESLFQLAAKICGRIKKVERDYEGVVPEKIKDLLVEYLAKIICVLEYFLVEEESDLSTVLQLNLDKLFDRKKRNVLKGDGDNR